MLIELPLSAASIGRVAGLSGAAVRAYRAGKTPSTAARRALEKSCGIDDRAWDTLDRASPDSSPIKQSDTARDHHAIGTTPPGTVVPARVDSSPSAENIAAIAELLEAVRATRRDGTLLASERLKAGAEERALLAMLDRARTQAATFEDNLLRLPAWRRVMSELKDILLPHREVHAEVSAWLRARLLEESST